MSDLKEKKVSLNFPPAVESLNAEPLNQSASLSTTSLAFSNKPTSPKRQIETASKIPNSYKNNLLSEKEASYFSKNVEKLSGNFTQLQHHVCELTELLKAGKRNLPMYPSSQEPSFINITCQVTLALEALMTISVYGYMVFVKHRIKAPVGLYARRTGRH